MPASPYEHITTDSQLIEYCRRIRNAPQIGFDTEFVSENTFHPQLCLIQVAIDDQRAVIDPLTIKEMGPFWDLLAAPGHETIVHAGREELRFCMRAVGRRPHQLFDLQIAAGLIGLEYPAAYSTLIQKLLNRSLPKGETRTDWRRRPLSPRQIEYAIQDVLYLQPLRNKLVQRLQELDRLDWFQAELESWQDAIIELDQGENWHRVSGISGLSNRSLAMVRELWRWRQTEAQRRDVPPKRVLRDDLIVELARRGTDDPKGIQAVRGMQRRDLQRHTAKLAAAIGRAKTLPDHELPSRPRRPSLRQLNTIGQFLHTALNCICRSENVAPSLAGSAQDVRDLIAYRLGIDESGHKRPLLAQGWRAKVVGSQLDEIIQGRTAIRVENPLAEEPLVFERTNKNSG